MKGIERYIKTLFLATRRQRQALISLNHKVVYRFSGFIEKTYKKTKNMVAVCSDLKKISYITESLFCLGCCIRLGGCRER
jgi:hypothetical protein